MDIVFKWLKEKWAWVAVTAGLIVVGIGTIIGGKKQTESSAKESHDDKVKAIDSTKEIFIKSEIDAEAAVNESNEKLARAENDSNKMQKKLSALQQEELTRMMAEKFGIKNMDRKP